jgi:hypothetical protein
MGFLEAKFDNYMRVVASPGVLTSVSDKISLQNEFGVYTRIKLFCEYDTQSKKTIAYSISSPPTHSRASPVSVQSQPHKASVNLDYSSEPLSVQSERVVNGVTEQSVADESRVNWPTRQIAEAQISSYCAQIVDKYTTEEICSTREIAAWARLSNGGAFRAADSITRSVCMDSLANYSFETEEACLEGRKVSQQLNPREFIGVGSRAGDELTVLSKRDLGTDHAWISAQLTRENAKHHCEEGDGNSTKECVDNHMKDEVGPQEIIANCSTGVFTTFGGGHYAFRGRSPSHASTPQEIRPAYIVKDLTDGATLNGSSASGYNTVIEAFNALCPNKVLAD